MTEYDKQVAHLAKLARTPGWWQYSRARARELESEMPGIAADVRAVVETLQFRPAQEERGEWWQP